MDDILDVEGAAANLGKTAGKDAAAGKPTYPAIHGLEASRAPGREQRRSRARRAERRAARRPPARHRALGADAHDVETARPRSIRWSSTRGLAGSRERARALILAGQVQVDGRVISKAGTAVAADSDVTLLQPDHPYVGRGGVKLAHALDGVRASTSTGALALDVGASTGGFTDVLLQRGARASSRSTSATDSSTGRFAAIRASSSSSASTRGTLTPDQLPSTRASSIS